MQQQLHQPLHTVNTRLYQQQQQTNKLNQLQFKHPSQAFRSSQQKQTQHQEVHTQNDRLTLLHSRLQQEAENIRKWKNTTELEIQQKTRQLHEAQVVIEKQQKSLIDIQLRNETLNSCIEEEVANQKEIQLKILLTREMCNALKEHICRIETAVDSGESDRKELVQHNTELTEQYTNLVEQFYCMEKQQMELYQSFTHKIEEERTANEELTAQLNELTSFTDQQIKELQYQLDMSENKCVHLVSLLETKAESITKLTDNKTKLEEKLAEKESNLRDLNTELEHSINNLKAKEDEASSLNNEINNLNTTITELQTTLDQHKRHSKELTELHETKEIELMKQKENIEQERNSVSKCLKETIDQLKITEEEKLFYINQHDSLQLNIKTVEDREKCLAKKLEELQNQFDQLTKAHVQSQDELSVCQKNVSDLKHDLLQKQKEKEGVRTTLTNMLDEKKNEISVLEHNITQLESSLSTLTSETYLELKSKEETVCQLQTEIKSLQLDMTSNNEQKNKEIQLLKDHVEQMGKTETALKEHIASLQTDLENQIELTSTSDKKMSEMGTDLELHEKSIRAYQMEISQLKSQHKEEINYFKSTTEILLSEKKKLQENVDSLIKQIELCQSKEKENKTALDAQAKEMGITLEKYKVENMQIVKQKDKEIEALKEIQSKELKKKEELENRISVLENELSENKQRDIELKQSIQKLEKQLSEKDTELAQLVAAANTLQSQIHSPKVKIRAPLPPLHSTTPKSTSMFKTPMGRTIPLATNSRLSNTSHLLKTPSSAKKEKHELECDLDDEAIFNKPKTPKVVAHQTMQAASNRRGNGRSNTRTNGRGNKSTRTTKSKVKEKTGENLSWFDLDPVFGFPPEN